MTRDRRRELVLMSADHYDWLMAAARRTHRTRAAADVVLDAVSRAEMDPEHDKLTSEARREGALDDCDYT